MSVDETEHDQSIPTFVKCEIEHGVALVVLNRPERLNAIGDEMGHQFDRTMVELAQNNEVRAVVLTGAGRGFCSGSDLERLDKFSKSGGTTMRTPERGKAQGRYQALDQLAPPELLNRYCAPQALPQPVIAAVNGPCAGVGLALAVMSDIRFAGPNAYFLAPFAKRGLVAETGLASSLSSVIGFGAAADMLLSGRKVGADEAFRMGLVQHLCAQERLLADALAYARDIAGTVSPRSTRIIKRQLWLARGQPFIDALALSMDETRASTRSEDFSEGLAHFREKRLPRFTGR
jgi:enoyl-CoA hydratase/carnithine racemase